MDKAVILARGLGTRMRRAQRGVVLDQRQEAIAQAGLKALIPIGRPFLDYVLAAVAEAGYRRVCLVVGPEHDAVRRYCEGLAPRRLRIEFAVQPEPRGTADAVAAAEGFAHSDPFLVINSDNYYPPEALRGLRAQRGMAVALFEQQSMLAGGNIPPERIGQFAVGKIDQSGLLVQILEKPDQATLDSLPRPLWVSMNCWRFGPGIFEACRRIRPSPRGELEIPDAVQYLIDVRREPFYVVRVHAPVLDLTSREDIATIAPKLAGLRVDL